MSQRAKKPVPPISCGASLEVGIRTEIRLALKKHGLLGTKVGCNLERDLLPKVLAAFEDDPRLALLSIKVAVDQAASAHD